MQKSEILSPSGAASLCLGTLTATFLNIAPRVMVNCANDSAFSSSLKHGARRLPLRCFADSPFISFLASFPGLISLFVLNAFTWLHWVEMARVQGVFHPESRVRGASCHTTAALGKIRSTSARIASSVKLFLCVDPVVISSQSTTSLSA